MAAHNTYIIDTKEQYYLYQKFYEALWNKLYDEKIKGKYEKSIIDGTFKRKLWIQIETIDKKFFPTTFGINDNTYFQRSYSPAKNQQGIIKIDKDAFIKAFTYLGFNPQITGRDDKLNVQISMFQEFLKEQTEEGKNLDLQRNSRTKFSELIGYTGKENVRIIIRLTEEPHLNLGNTNEYDRDTANIIKNLLDKEKIPYTYERIYTNEKHDKDESDYDPFEEITINDNDIFIVIGLYGYNLIPEATLIDSQFFRSLFFKWDDPPHQTEYTSILFNNSRRYSAIYEDKIRNKGGISHGIFSRIKYKNYTYVLCGGVGQHGTEVLGIVIKSKKDIIYESIFNKSSNPHSYAILFELNLNEPPKSKILDSVILTVS